MHVKQLEITGSSNVGLYAFATDTYAVVGETVPDSTQQHLEEVLEVPIFTTTMLSTGLVGAFLTGNNNVLLVPSQASKHEVEALKDLPVPVKTVNTTFTCLGNNVLMNDEAALLNPEFSDEETQHVANQASVECMKTQLAERNAVGSLGAFNAAKQRLVISNDVTEEEFEFVKEYFDVEATPTSINLGTPYVRTGLICNKNGFVIGKESGGAEVSRVDEGLGYL
jgi:translation initiation factor 6